MFDGLNEFFYIMDKTFTCPNCGLKSNYGYPPLHLLECPLYISYEQDQVLPEIPVNRGADKKGVNIFIEALKKIFPTRHH
ncbi:hypothetical protein A2154_01165 [Candidatus Gottesmanbacteria bacterium RBG_16_43_7]|uniref:Uncharacterized protein n=1 Tax=Candidatus Gottesmanbacteria bacterium RBG_16_43_7 TaxID=1798373 RepID=A0A1F5ZAF4_9BACT|nr:MAG: hypothetical protein A2154_01165 [Candidatus Gottesmanbacteria bacterium RBG_16_43_7]